MSSTSDLLAVIDGFLDEKGHVHGTFVEKYLKCTFSSTSVLQMAIESTNTNVSDFLIKNCTNFIQHLPLEHQIDISTSVYKANKLELLCDLLKISDFPFPHKLDQKSVTNEQLLEIIEERVKFHDVIVKEVNNKKEQARKISEIENFLADNENLKYAYNLENKSAFCQALFSKKYKVFFLLKSFGFEDRQIEYNEKDIENEEERNYASNFAWVQSIKNISISNSDPNKAVKLQLKPRVCQIKWLFSISTLKSWQNNFVNIKIFNPNNSTL